ncbi:MAG: hypothetical protein WAT70_11215 [Rhizobiaceae bacterium]
MRTTLLALLTGIALVVPASAIERHVSTGMTCSAVQSTIRAEGAALMQHESALMPGMTVSGRYVANEHFCGSGERVIDMTIPASDNPECLVKGCTPFGGHGSNYYTIKDSV